MRPKAAPERISEQMRVFGQNMRTARKARGLAQDNPLLKKAKLDKAMVSYLELGERSPRLATILRVARVLGVTPQALLEGIGTNAAAPELPPPRLDLEQPEARFGANLRWMRKREGVSQMELGGEANIHRVGVGAIERGERSPKLHTILKLAWTLEVPAAVLLHGVQGNHGLDGASGSD